MLKKIRYSALLTLIIPFFSQAKSPAISSLYVDTGKVQKIYLSPGAPSLLAFPCNIIAPLKDTGGNIEGAQVDGPRRLVIWLKSSASQPSSLTVICERQVFVFNVIPGNAHQAYIQILGAFGRPELANSSIKVLNSSIASMKGRTIPYSQANPKKIIASSKEKKR